MIKPGIIINTKSDLEHYLKESPDDALLFVELLKGSKTKVVDEAVYPADDIDGKKKEKIPPVIKTKVDKSIVDKFGISDADLVDMETRGKAEKEKKAKKDKEPKNG